MRPLRAWLLRLCGLFGKRRRDRELADELESHLQMHIDDNVRSGMPPEEARRQALIQIGGVEQTKEMYRDRRGLPWLETLLQDVRFGFRMLAKSPGLTVIVIITLALGIGANATIFSVVDSFLIRPLPVPNPGQIVVLASLQQGAPVGASNFSYADFADFRQQTSGVFSDLFAYTPDPVGLSADGNAEVITAACVTGNYFSGLRLKPALGGFFLPGEGERPGGAPNVVLSYSYWQRRFGGSRSVIGKQVRVNGSPGTIIGVAPKGFHGTYSIMDMQAYLPLNMFMQGPDLTRMFTVRQMRLLRVMARLKPGVSVDQAQSAVGVVAERLAQQHASTDKGVSVRVMPETLSRPNPDLATTLPAVLGLFLLLAGLVLVLACLNVANILFARATVRQREMAIRSALGAGRTRLIRQVLTEALILALLGGAAGVILGNWASVSIGFMLPKTNPPFHLDFSFDWRVFAYSFVAALVAGFIVGMWPAWRAAHTNLNTVLHEGGRSDSSGPARHRVRSALVALQLAGSLTLLIVAGLFVRSLGNAERKRLGFDPTHLLSVVLDPHEIGYNQTRTKAFYRRLEDGVLAMPGVQSASLAFDFPMSPFSDSRLIEIEGHPVPVGQQPPLVLFNQVDPGYFETMRMPLLRGRPFVDSDNEKAPPVAIVNETMAAKFWPGQEPIGKRFRIVGSAWAEIVGVAANGVYMDLGETPQPFFYVPLAQSYTSLRSLEVRSAIPPKALIREVQQKIRALAPDLPIFDAETMKQTLSGANGDFIFRFGATMAGVMGFIGLILAAVGVYGMMAFSMAQRTREIGIRMALGASRRDVLRIVLRQGLAIVAAGTGVGLACGWVLTHAMGRLAAGPGTAGPLIYSGATLLLICVALLACWLPARRAMRVDPMVALRYE
ncbi:MAG: ADOP family duplicated permease [Candidatus Acidiferrales bacterium]